MKTFNVIRPSKKIEKMKYHDAGYFGKRLFVLAKRNGLWSAYDHLTGTSGTYVFETLKDARAGWYDGLNNYVKRCKNTKTIEEAEKIIEDLCSIYEVIN